MIARARGRHARAAAGFAFANGGRAFRHRNYRLFFGGQLVSPRRAPGCSRSPRRGSSSSSPSDPLILGLTTALAFLPVLVLGLFGGLIADALPKRQTLIVTQAVQMTLAFILFALVVTDTVQVWQILVLATILGITNAVDMPTRQAFTVEMVGREDVANAVALNSAVFNGARIVGPGDRRPHDRLLRRRRRGRVPHQRAVSFLAVIIAYAAMRESDLQPPPRLRPPGLARRGAHESLAEGLRYVRRDGHGAAGDASRSAWRRRSGSTSASIIPALAEGASWTPMRPGTASSWRRPASGRCVAALGIAFSGRSRPVDRAARRRSILGLGAARGLAGPGVPDRARRDAVRRASARSRWPRPRTRRSSSPSPTSCAAA